MRSVCNNRGEQQTTMGQDDVDDGVWQSGRGSRNGEKEQECSQSTEKVT